MGMLDTKGPRWGRLSAGRLRGLPAAGSNGGRHRPRRNHLWDRQPSPRGGAATSSQVTALIHWSPLALRSRGSVGPGAIMLGLDSRRPEAGLQQTGCAGLSVPAVAWPAGHHAGGYAHGHERP